MRNRLVDVLGLLGNLGLILGLALVGVQIYQNTEIARMQMVHQDFLAIESGRSGRWREKTQQKRGRKLCRTLDQ